MLQFLPLIGAGISALASLFAPKPEPVVVENKTDLVSMREEAVRAGFNPVSVLRSGAWSGFSRSTQTGGVAHNPWGDAAQAIGSGLMNFSWNPLNDELTKSAIRLNDAQAGSFSAQMFKTAGSATQRVTTSNGGWTPRTSKVETVGGPVVKLQTGRFTENILLPGAKAEDVEAELGELAGDLYGVNRWLHSWLWQTFEGRPAYYQNPDGSFKKDGPQRKMYTGGGF